MERGLVELKEEILTIVTERFERRLSEELSGVRGEMHAGNSGLRQEIHEGAGVLRKEMHEGFALVRQEAQAGDSALRKEMYEGFALLRGEIQAGDSAIRGDMYDGFSMLRKDMVEQRVELLRWSFLFWLGQIAAMATMFNVMLRALER